MLGRFFSRKEAPLPLRVASDRIDPYVAAPSLIDDLSDTDLARLNALLPWAAYTLDSHGRRFGRAHSTTKRSTPQAIPDPRIKEFDRRYALHGQHVLEVGCFEGLHTVALARCGAHVTAVDSRIENVAKTAVRCAAYSAYAKLGIWDVELPAPPHVALDCDLLHHVGVLYHLRDPVAHLAYLLPHVGSALLLDTHVAASGAATRQYRSGGVSYHYQPYREGGREDPFSGMHDHAKWLPESLLLALLGDAGFTVDDLQRRAERNGPRVQIFARRGRDAAG